MGYLDLNQVWTIVSFSRFESRFYRFGLAFQLPLPFLVRFLRTTSTIAAPTRLSKSKSILCVLGGAPSALVKTYRHPFPFPRTQYRLALQESESLRFTFGRSLLKSAARESNPLWIRASRPHRQALRSGFAR